MLNHRNATELLGLILSGQKTSLNPTELVLMGDAAIAHIDAFEALINTSGYTYNVDGYRDTETGFKKHDKLTSGLYMFALGRESLLASQEDDART